MTTEKHLLAWIAPHPDTFPRHFFPGHLNGVLEAGEHPNYIQVNAEWQSTWRESLSPEEVIQSQTDLIHLLREKTPKPEWDSVGWPQWEQLAPHLDALFRQVAGSEIEWQIAPLVHLYGRWRQRREEFPEAQRYFRKTLQLWDDRSTKELRVGALNNLALNLKLTGQFDEAEKYYREVLTLEETPTLLNNLANLLFESGSIPEAEALHLKAQDLLKHAPNPWDMIPTLNNLGALYEATDRRSQARPLHQQALELARKHLGSEHLTTSVCLTFLGKCERDDGNFQEAERLFLESLEVKKHTMGLNCDGAVQILAHLGTTYIGMDEYEKAIEAYTQAIVTAERIYPDTITFSNLIFDRGELYQAIGDHASAKKDLEKAAGLYGHLLDINHSCLIRILLMLGECCTELEEYQEAKAFYERALHIAELERDEFKQGVALGRLAELLHLLMDDEDGAVLFYRKCIPFLMKFPQAEKQLVKIYFSYALLISSRETDYEEGIQMLTHCLDITDTIYGEKSVETADALRNLGGVYFETKQFPAAEMCFRRQVEVEPGLTNRPQRYYFRAMEKLADTLMEMGEFPESEVWNRRAIAFCEQMAPEVGKPLRGLRLIFMSELFTRMGRHREAQESKNEGHRLLNRSDDSPQGS